MRRRTLLLWWILALSLGSAEANAGCCNVLKLDPTLPQIAVRVCEPDGTGACGAVLFEGELSIGQSQNVCAEAGTVVYQERAPEATEYDPSVTAVCDGADVEI
jgi:hypothetical protein